MQIAYAEDLVEFALIGDGATTRTGLRFNGMKRGFLRHPMISKRSIRQECVCRLLKERD